MRPLINHTGIDLQKMSKILTTVNIFFLLILFSAPTHGSELCEKVFSVQTSLNNNSNGAQFLFDRDQRLHMNPLVKRIAERNQAISSKPVDRITGWLNYLDSTYKKVQNNPRAINEIKKIFYRQYVIKPENIPESYFNWQAKLARERGEGDVVFTEAQKKEMSSTIINDQKNSIDQWVEYLLSPEAEAYPSWVKYWMFTGMVKLSKLNLTTESFGNRSKDTVAPFPELNAEALAYVMDAILEKVNRKEISEVQDQRFLDLLNGAQFGKMYAHALLKIGLGKTGNFPTNEGKWIVYKRGQSDALVKSLQGRNTGWCTAGQGRASFQLSEGNFYVYYSLDAEGNPTRPRVAIRMKGEEIAEIRGVGPNQNLDSQISSSPIIKNKMKEFGEKAEKFVKQDLHMKTLTSIDNKVNLGQALSKEELEFLYETKERIVSFGQFADPRIKEIKSKRDVRSDWNILLNKNYALDEISITDEEVFNGKTKMHIGTMHFSEKKLMEGRKFPETFVGSIGFSSLEVAKGLELPETMLGDIYLNKLESAAEIKFPRNMVGNIYVFGIFSKDGLEIPENFRGRVHFRDTTYRKP